MLALWAIRNIQVTREPSSARYWSLYLMIWKKTVWTKSSLAHQLIIRRHGKPFRRNWTLAHSLIIQERPGKGYGSFLRWDWKPHPEEMAHMEGTHCRRVDDYEKVLVREWFDRRLSVRFDIRRHGGLSS